MECTGSLRPFKVYDNEKQKNIGSLEVHKSGDVEEDYSRTSTLVLSPWVSSYSISNILPLNYNIKRQTADWKFYIYGHLYELCMNREGMRFQLMQNSMTSKILSRSLSHLSA